MTDIRGTRLSPEDAGRLQHPATGGVILFADNFESREQITALIRELRALRDPELLVAVDQEGGRVQRFQKGFVRLPACRAYGRAWDHSRDWGRDLAWLGGWVMALEMREIGIDLSFAPVLDVDLCNSKAIGSRAFHQTAAGVTQLASAWVDGMQYAGMHATGKHFPGHGGVEADSHNSLPRESRSLRALEQCDLAPFDALLNAGKLSAIMTAHVVYEQIDDKPPTFSPRWLKRELRDSRKFTGVVFSDDLHMQAAHFAGGPAHRAMAALAAGCDVPLICRDAGATDEILAAVFAASGNSEEKLADRHGDPMGTLCAQERAPQDWSTALADASAVLEKHV